jgi:uncharacterized protein YdeI (YjbR/CyaY-like superfamily)
MKTIDVKTRTEWRKWLSENHLNEGEIWLVYYKKETGIPSIAYKDSLDEALCFGWVDSLIRKIDEKRYARKFTPRKDNSKWSVVNKQRVEQLIQDDLMTEHGLRKVEAAKRSGSWDAPVQKPKLDLTMPEAFASALKNNPTAEEEYNKLAPSHQKEYLVWIITAKRQATKEKRIAEAISLLAEGRKLGLR